MVLEEFLYGERREVSAEIDHDRDVGYCSCFNGGVYRMPETTPVMRDFDAYDELAVFFGRYCCRFAVHITRVLFIRAAAHAGSYDIEKCEYPGLGVIDDAFFEFGEAAPAGATGIHYGCNACFKGKAAGCIPSGPPAYSLSPPFP